MSRLVLMQRFGLSYMAAHKYSTLELDQLYRCKDDAARRILLGRGHKYAGRRLMSEHRLTEYESDFLEPGYKAVCSCGWQSENVPTMVSADLEHQIHVREVDQQEREVEQQRYKN